MNEASRTAIVGYLSSHAMFDRGWQYVYVHVSCTAQWYLEIDVLCL